MTQEKTSEPSYDSRQSTAKRDIKYSLILNIVYLGQREEKKAKFKETEVHYVCLMELEPRIYLHTFPQRSSSGNPCRNRQAPEADTKRKHSEV